MKKALLLSIFTLSLVSVSQAHALIQTLSCSNAGSGEGGSTLSLSTLRPALPGQSGSGVVRLTEGNLAGKFDSGPVTVEIIVAADGGPMTLVNKGKGLSVTLMHKGTNKRQVSAHFLDQASKQNGLVNTTMTCEESN